MSIGTIITCLTLIVVPANLVAQYQLSKGNLKFTYPLLVFVYALYITIETILAFNDPSQMSILLFNVVNVWALIMAIRGSKRLKRMEALVAQKESI
jgi:uncharacterized membrane protein